MKRQVCSKLTIALGLALIGFSSFSAQTIYGLQSASQFRSNSASNFYVQVGSYRSKSNAAKIKASLQNKTSHPVLLKESHGYYIVLIGPIHSAAAVRAAAEEVSGHSAGVVVVKTLSKSKNSQTEAPVIPGQKQGKLKPKSSVGVYKDKDGFVLPSNKWYVGLGAGALFSFGTASTNFASSGMPGFPDDRYAGDRIKNTGQFSALAGYQWRRPAEWFPAYSLGLQYSYISSSKVKGFIWVNDLPDTRNFTYRYDLSQQLALAKVKVDIYRWGPLMPYVSAGAGAAFNRVKHYSDSPIPGATLMQRRDGFNSASRTQFSGTVGAGLDYWVTDKGQLSLGYELSYYGKATTGNGQGVLSANRLENKLNSNAVILQAVYFFDWL